MLRLIGRRTAYKSASGGVDSVLLGISLPSDTVINRISFNGFTVPQINTLEMQSNEVMGIALEAWILPIDDPDATANFDDVWDTLVPKDTDAQTLDLDAETVDSQAFFEPGEVDWQSVFDVGIRPRRIWHHHKYLHIGNTTGVVFVDSQTPFSPKWQPGASYGFRSKRRMRIEQPSVLLVGISVPAFDDTTSTLESPLAENEWPRVKYLGDVLIFALHEVLGLTEATAETPFEEAADLLQRHLDPDVFEGSNMVNQLVNNGMAFFGEIIVDHEVTGTLAIQTVDTGR